MGLFRQKLPQNELNLAVEAWKRTEHSGEGLSSQARSRILTDARDARQERLPLGPLGSLFLPARQALALGAAPALLLAAAFVLGAPWRGPSEPVEGAALTLHAEKRGAEVIFVIANGGRPHVVRRSSFADGRHGSDRLSTSGGAFRDSLGGGPDLVYYRID